MLINSLLAIPAKKVIFPGRLPHKVKFIQINLWYFKFGKIRIDDITLKEIERVVAQAPSRKSCARGPDNIYADYFKNLKLFPIITSLFKLCFQSSVFPKVWHKAIILPIPKSGNTRTLDPLNYRGIALQCNLHKVYTSILNYRLNLWLEYNDIIAME